MSLQRIIWLASYPKSGNTWMRYFLAQYFMPKGQAPDINNIRQFTTADVRQDFFDRAAGQPFRAATFDAWLEMRQRALTLIAESRPGTHFVKTHCQILRVGPHDVIPPRLTAAAIYILRNPFDVTPSYARHIGVDIDTAIDRLIDAKSLNRTETGLVEILGRWDEHAESWLGAAGLPRHMIRYEDMSAEPAATFRSLLNFLQVPVSEGKLRRALRASSFTEMRKQEERKGFRERPAGMERFFHGGVAGAWREALSPSQVARLLTAFRPTLERYYPELLADAEAAAA